MEIDQKLLGKNIKTIRKWFKKSNEEFASFLGISISLVEKMQSGDKPVSRDLLEKISSLSGCPIFSLLYFDLSLLDGNLNFDKTLNDFISEGFLKKTTSKLFPIIPSDTSSKLFQKGMEAVDNEFFKYDMTFDVFDKTANLFFESFQKEDVEEGVVNALSCLGIYWITISISTTCNVNSSLRDLAENINNSANKKAAENSKKVFLKSHEKLISRLMSKARESKKYSDYAYYFLALRYWFGMMDSDITNMDQFEEKSFGISLLDCLENMGNSFAHDFFKD